MNYYSVLIFPEQKRLLIKNYKNTVNYNKFGIHQAIIQHF